MEFTTRKTVNDKLSKYCYCAKEDDFIEITEWANGEGFDIQINDDKHFMLTRGELDAIEYLVRSLEYHDR